ncbi:MAG: hypothetical protein KAH84_02540 [Thiomargarita sp.]|nr:hypothetical protein [Thiomargarita sp.]
MNIHKLLIFLAVFFCYTNLLATALNSPLLPKGEQLQNFEHLFKNVIPRKPISAITLSDKILAASIDDSVYLWDIQLGTEIKRLGNLSNKMINSLTFNSTAKFLAIGYDDLVQIWDINLGQQIQQLAKQSGDFTTLTFSPKNSNLLALGSVTGMIYLWDWSNNQLVKQWQGHSTAVNTLAFNSNARLLASGGSDAVIYLWEVLSDEKQILQGHLDVVTSVKFNENGDYLASASWDKTVRLWSIKSDELNQAEILTGHSAAINTLDFSPDGKNLISGAMDNTIGLWDLQAKNKPVKFLLGHTNNIIAVVFSPTGHFFASASWDKTVRLWQANQEIQRFEGHASSVYKVAFNPIDKTLISSSNAPGFTIWHNLSSNFSSGIRYLATNEKHPINAYDISPNGKILAFSAKNRLIYFLDLQSGRKIKHLLMPSEVNTLAFSPNGQILAIGTRYPTELQPEMSSLYLLSGEKLNTLNGHTNHVFALAFSPDGQVLASGSDDKTIKLWNISSGENIKTLEGHEHFITSIAFNSEGNLLASGSWDKTVRLWDVLLGKEIKRLNGHSHYVTAVSFSPNNHILASSSWDKTIRLWEIISGKLLHSLTNHTDFVNSIAFNQTGDFLASGSKDSTIRLWEVNTGKLNQVMIKGAGATWASCHILTQRCWRVDDGTLLVNKQPNGRIESILPQVKQAKPLHIESSVESIVLDYNKPATFSLSISNHDTIPVYWIKLRQVFEPQNPLIFYPPATHLVLKAHEHITLPVKISTWLNNNPQTTQLNLSISTAQHQTQSIVIPVRIQVPNSFSWVFLLSLLALFISIILYYLSLYYHPIVQTLSADSSQLLALSLEQLPKAKRLLRMTFRLDSVLSSNDSHLKWLNQAINFIQQSNSLRCQLLANRLSATVQSHKDIFILHLSANFPLKLDRLIIYFPPVLMTAQEIIWRLRQDDISFQATLVINLEPTLNLQTYAQDRTNLWVIPNSRELTNLLLSPHPIEIFTKLLSQQLAITYLSPYQTQGGITKSNAFFGREQILAQIFNRELRNYLVIGGRQLGKTSLLRQIERYYQHHPKIECVYLSVGRSDKKIFNQYLTNLPNKRQSLLLIDEADIFIQREMATDYPMLNHFRNLSEEGRCYFILAGFWDLYQATVLDYHSPIKNFGESITIGALEPKACRKLAIEPMKMLGINYDKDELVERIVVETGQRANLIAIVCDEMLKDLTLKQKITTKIVSKALKNKTISEMLGGWTQLTNDKPAASLDRIIVYATVEKGEFELSELITLLGQYNYTTEQLMQSLTRLELAYVIQREKRVYYYSVSLFREILLEQAVDSLLKHELFVNNANGC